MATITNAIAGGTASTNNQSTYVSGSFTPAAGDLLVVTVCASGTVTDPAALTASANGLTFTQVLRATKNSSADSLYVFIANEPVPASPAAMTVTFDSGGDPATGAIIAVGVAAGMSKYGLSAVRQSAKVDNVAGGTAPQTVFSANALTDNPTIFSVLTTVGVGTTPPTNWTEQVDATYSTPTTGGGYSSRDSGFTGTTITLGSSTNGACCAIAVELDASAPAPPFLPPAYRLLPILVR